MLGPRAEKLQRVTNRHFMKRGKCRSNVSLLGKKTDIWSYTFTPIFGKYLNKIY